MSALFAGIVGLTLMAGVLLLGYSILSDLRRERRKEAYMLEQERLLRRLQTVPFYTIDREQFFNQVDEYRSAFDGR
jgi:hypothetical protein